MSIQQRARIATVVAMALLVPALLFDIVVWPRDIMDNERRALYLFGVCVGAAWMYFGFLVAMRSVWRRIPGAWNQGCGAIFFSACIPVFYLLYFVTEAGVASLVVVPIFAALSCYHEFLRRIQSQSDLNQS